MTYGLRPMRRPLMRDPRLLIDWRGGTPFPAGAYARGGDAYTRDRAGVYVPVGAGVPRTTWGVDAATGEMVARTLLEPGATNLTPNSSDFGTGMGWGGSSEWTVTPAASILQGQVASHHKSLSTGTDRNRWRDVGSYTGQPETLYIIIENENAATTDIRFPDIVTAATIVRARLTWATGEVSIVAGAGTPFARHLGIGPNGGPVYLFGVTVTGAAGAGRRVFIHPTGQTQNSAAAILHHVQLETGGAATSPIVTGAAAASRSPDSLYLPLPPEIRTPGAALAVYSRYVMLHDPTVGFATSPVAWAISNASGTGPRVYHYQNSANRRVSLRHDVSPTSTPYESVSLTSPVPMPGDLVETLSLVWEEIIAGRRMLCGRLIASVNRGPVSGGDLPPLAPVPAWSGDRFYIGSRGVSPGVYGWERLAVWRGYVPGSDAARFAYARGEI